MEYPAQPMRYMKPSDIYVHADIHGASSVVVKNPTGQPVPPKTLNEAGTMAISYSVAWEAKVVTSAWWVNAPQVTKTAPTGEYLTTGSFMVRGKKNYLPPCHLIMGLSFLFKLEDDSIARHKDERRVRVGEEEIIETKEEEVELEDIEEIDDEEEKKIDEEEKNISASETESDDDNPKFPDTQIKMQHFQGTNINIVTESATPQIDESDSDSEKVVYLGDDKPVVLKPSGGRSRGSSESTVKSQKSQPKETQKKEDDKQAQVKRGQKGKLKKIKEKYKDQDEEERKLRMEILQTSTKPKDTRKAKKLLKEHQQATKPQFKKPAPKPRPTPADADDTGEPEDDNLVAAEVDMIDSLTGQPITEDELLFAVPVVAPYNTLTNYKYKVKLTPGTGKRGKAARTAVTMFLKDRSATQREKDLLKSVKDENLARNLPGKVKVSAPKLQGAKK